METRSYCYSTKAENINNCIVKNLNRKIKIKVFCKAISQSDNICKTDGFIFLFQVHVKPYLYHIYGIV